MSLKERIEEFNQLKANLSHREIKMLSVINQQEEIIKSYSSMVMRAKRYIESEPIDVEERFRAAFTRMDQTLKKIKFVLNTLEE